MSSPLPGHGGKQTHNGTNGNKTGGGKSKSPMPHRGKTPPPRQRKNKKNSNGDRSRTPPPPRQQAADMSVLIHRVDLYDSGARPEELLLQEAPSQHHPSPCTNTGGPNYPKPPVAAFQFVDPTSGNNTAASYVGNCEEREEKEKGTHHQSKRPAGTTVATFRVAPEHLNWTGRHSVWMRQPVVDNATPVPQNWHAICSGMSDPALIKKYWNQRRRLFSRFDQGVQLDEQGWYSVTPEQIADHVAMRLEQLCCLAPPAPSSMSSLRPTTTNGATTQNLKTSPPQCNKKIVVLDAFCGCGGNSIAFAKHPNVTVIGVDMDRNKLRNAAANAAIYDIPTDKLILIDCNALFVLEHCYSNGEFVLDQPKATPEAAMAMVAAMPPPAETEQTKDGYLIGGIDLLPRHIDAVFMDPPWGGVDYNVLGKHGYDLQRNMKIQRTVTAAAAAAAAAPAGEGLGNDFFDTFSQQTQQQNQHRSKQERKKQFNSELDESNCVNGAELLALAAAATARHWVIYDLPRNTNRTSLGAAALAAGYRGNCKFEEHFLNGRLKTVTAYFGSDFSHLVHGGESN